MMTTPLQRREAADGRQPTADAGLDQAVLRLQEGRAAFARLSLSDRIALARAMQVGYLKIAERSVRAACEAKGIPLRHGDGGRGMGDGAVERDPPAAPGRGVARRSRAHGEYAARAGGTIARRPAHGERVPHEPHRRGAVQGHLRRRALPGGRGGGLHARRARTLLQGLPPAGAHRADSWGGEHRGHSGDGCDHQALQRREGLPPQDESGERLSGTVAGGGLLRADPARLPVRGLRWAGGGGVPRAAPRDR